MYKPLILLLCCIILFSCKKFLDAKPDKSLVIPETVKDAENLLNDFYQFNIQHPNLARESDDNILLTDNSFSILNERIRANYIWRGDNNNESEWIWQYRTIMTANIILEAYDKASIQPIDSMRWNTVKGAALFYRANAFFTIAQYFAKPYAQTNAATDAGIPLKLKSDIDQPTVRASLAETYNRIIQDAKEAAALLPQTTEMPYYVSRPAAYALLARVYLIMADYSNSLYYCQQVLSIKNTLLNYNQLSTTAAFPIPRFNAEVIFHITPLGSSALNQNHWKVAEELYNLYDNNDLRKLIFFKETGSGVYTFKGDYNNLDPLNPGVRFDGFTTSEIWLIMAECHARLGNTTAAINALNTILLCRYRTGTFIPLSNLSAEQTLEQVLTERRKELVMRCTRWYDLRRLNLYPATQKTLIRFVNGQQFILPPNDNRYTFLIPQQVISASGIAQNPR